MKINREARVQLRLRPETVARWDEAVETFGFKNRTVFLEHAADEFLTHNVIVPTNIVVIPDVVPTNIVETPSPSQEAPHAGLRDEAMTETTGEASGSSALPIFLEDAAPDAGRSEEAPLGGGAETSTPPVECTGPSHKIGHFCRRCKKVIR